MEPLTETNWKRHLKDPSLERKEKPRINGLTMIIDKGMGVVAFKDLLELASEYIDFIKLGFGTAILTPIPVLKQKLNLAKQHQVQLYPGGTFFEVAYNQGQLQHYFHVLRKIGFDWLEISDGTITLDAKDRAQMIREAVSRSFRVITEIGKKEKGSVTPIPQLVDTFHRDRESGADYVIVEGRESGKNIGMYNANGDVDTDYVREIYRQVNPHRIWWECPQSSQQITILKIGGADANLGNIPMQEILSVESLRRGLRSDTLFTFGKDIRERSPL
ncbi:phosphosulfolactate synthase [Melghirimyces algeriensis]|uniref:Phosphosulfolactate synthase n=1 Tax=Melghirimyces algeriensis TaxID=910412 RepID=A0A521AXH5_9BACL|nr:phosphosulfolactate synthase [Melghirimyces algeriensis]SMO39547.1 phosphosulfolactate synthase [Melghirimyces algeriensis]